MISCDFLAHFCNFWSCGFTNISNYPLPFLKNYNTPPDLIPYYASSSMPFYPPFDEVWHPLEYNFDFSFNIIEHLIAISFFESHFNIMSAVNSLRIAKIQLYFRRCFIFNNIKFFQISASVDTARQVMSQFMYNLCVSCSAKGDKSEVK